MTDKISENEQSKQISLSDLLANDWTIGENGRCNSSEIYKFLQFEIQYLIKSSAHDLLSGNVNNVAGLIVAQLAHKWKLQPTLTIEEMCEIRRVG